MYKETIHLLDKQSDKKQIVDEHKDDTPLQKKQSGLVFLEILCPQTKQRLNSRNCHKCKHKKILYRQHPRGQILETIICNFHDETD
ncbi:MAG: hypothetical protein ACTSXO_11995 [Candidatus Heimdallarchaeota archaeon]|nr:MAG: hypothetical protein DRO91_06920 [Candidatus Heimdallarchaeota archaeon]RLI71058.1 MAG: hypothetical protein DRP02_06010 [Candidatus Gerdarchaeota archaeon]